MNYLGGRVLLGGWPEDGDEMPWFLHYHLLRLNNPIASSVCVAAHGCRKKMAGWEQMNGQFVDGKTEAGI